jgi:hypothetical protein
MNTAYLIEIKTSSHGYAYCGLIYNPVCFKCGTLLKVDCDIYEAVQLSIIRRSFDTSNDHNMLNKFNDSIKIRLICAKCIHDFR